MKKMYPASKVIFRNKRPYVRDTNIPVELLVGLGVSEVKKNYPWLEESQIQDALEFVQELIKKPSAKSKVKISST